MLPVAPFHYAIEGAVLVGVRRDSCTCEVGMAHEGYMAPRNVGRAEGFLLVFLVDILKQPQKSHTRDAIRFRQNRPKVERKTK